MGSIGDVGSFVDAAGLSLEDLTDVDNDDLQALFDELQVTSVKLKLQVQAVLNKMKKKQKPSESTNDDPDVQITGLSTSSPAQPADLARTFVNAAALRRSKQHSTKARYRLD